MNAQMPSDLVKIETSRVVPEGMTTKQVIMYLIETGKWKNGYTDEETGSRYVPLDADCWIVFKKPEVIDLLKFKKQKTKKEEEDAFFANVYLEPHTEDEHLDINHMVHKCEGGHKRYSKCCGCEKITNCPYTECGGEEGVNMCEDCFT